jgi:hypothetical protein
MGKMTVGEHMAKKLILGGHITDFSEGWEQYR